MTDLAWSHSVRDIPDDGLQMEREATEAERAAVAAALEIQAVEALKVRYRIQATGAGRYRFTGHLDARLVQACVVSLEPVPAAVSGPIEAQFCPPGAALEGQPSDDDLDAPEIEPIDGGILAIGRLVYEELASRLDPFPRLADASLEQSQSPAASAADHPFSVLARLRPGEPKS